MFVCRVSVVVDDFKDLDRANLVPIDSPVVLQRGWFIRGLKDQPVVCVEPNRKLTLPVSDQLFAPPCQEAHFLQHLHSVEIGQALLKRLGSFRAVGPDHASVVIHVPFEPVRGKTDVQVTIPALSLRSR